MEQSLRALEFRHGAENIFLQLSLPPSIAWRDMTFIVYSSANSPLKQATGI
jgi:hypothetical protein